jgi:electron transport complex protein RnfD
MSDQLLTVSPSPHVKGGNSIKKLMYGVILALVPAFLASFFYFGIGFLIVVAISVLSCVLFEYLILQLFLKGNGSITDGSAIVTGLLLGLCLPSNLPFWIVIIGSLIAIGVGKMTFGGLGKNPFNPALVGRVFLFISFPQQMTNYPKPVHRFAQKYLDATTGATPLGKLQEANDTTIPEIMNQVPSNQDLFLGNMGGSAGEVAAVALILGMLYLLVKKIITWHIPVSILGTVFLFTGVLHIANPAQFSDPVFHLLTGGLMLGAVFMATDYVTSPMTGKGMIVYGVGIGIITVLIRVFGAYPEGVQFAILIMNAFVPLIDKYIKPRLYGKIKTAKN